MEPARQQGYTLLELVVVISVVALIAAIAVPATTSSNSDKELELVADRGNKSAEQIERHHAVQ